MDINTLLSQAVNTQQASWYIITLAFIAGILVSFTPCVYPMIPITAGILQSQAQRSMLHNFFAALAYITGIALVYALLGYLSATTALIFGIWFSKPWFMILVSAFFLYLAGSLFGVYELHMPRFLQTHATTSKSGSIMQCFMFGIISGTVASPCLTPALALLLGIVAKQANPILGFFTLFSFSLGMGILLLIIGTFSGTLALMPRAGEWMNIIKSLFGFMIIATVVYFLKPMLGHHIVLGSYVGIAGTATLYYVSKAKDNKLALLLCIASIASMIIMISKMITQW